MEKSIYIYILIETVFNISCSAENTQEIKRLSGLDKTKLAYAILPKVEQIDLLTVLPYCTHCFVYINLYNPVDLTSSSTPTILSRFAPVISSIYNKIELVPIQLYFKVEQNGPIRYSKHNVSQLCVSNFFDKFTSYFCTRIHKSKFVLKSRPWNFEQYFYRLPPLKYHDHAINNIWINNPDNENSQIKREIICIVLSEMETNKLWLWAQSYQYSKNFIESPNEHKILIAIKLGMLKLQNRKLSIFFPYEISLFNQITSRGNIGSPSSLQIREYVSRELKNAQNISRWGLVQEFSTFKECSNFNTFPKLIFSVPLNTILKCVKTTILWKYIFGSNFILLPDDIFQFPRIEIEFVASYEIYSLPLIIAHPPTQTIFIACGDTYLKKSGRFDVCLKSFETQVWLAIIITFAIYAPIVWTIYGQDSANVSSKFFMNVVTVFLAIFKNLTEQSTPFSSNLLASKPLRVLSTHILICIIVLSNAYKNDNMYELMAPKRFRPYETFEQILNASYTVYSLPTYLRVAPECNRNVSELSHCIDMASKTKHSLEYRYLYFILLEIKSNLISQTNKLYKTEKPIDTLPQTYQYAHNYSKLWIKPVYELAELIRKTYSSFPDKMNSLTALRIDFDETFAEITSLEELAACNNTAFLIESTKVEKWKMILSGKGIKKISTGGDVLIEKHIGYSLKGWIPAFILQRISGVKSSGILEWWNKFVSNHLVKVRTLSGRLMEFNEKYTEFYNRQSNNVDEENSRSFFVVFHLVIEMGFLGLFLCVSEICYSILLSW